MRVGLLIRGDSQELKWANHLGFRAAEWIRFEESSAASPKGDWKGAAEAIAGEAQALGVRLSAIGALYRNPLHPEQSDFARTVFRQAIEVASHLGIKTVAGFPGAHVETEVNANGGNPVYKPFESFIPELVAFWDPIAQFAADKGVRIAFEHCPQGPYHLPVMNYNMLGQPAMWERFFNATKQSNLGLEWDASHLVCQFIDPVANIHKFGSKIFHVHAKDAHINRRLLEEYGICHPGVAEHRFPGLGQSNWAEIVHALLRAGYDSDLNIEGWHDPVYRDHTRPEKVTLDALGKYPLQG
ncbi:MAG TPA: sugar phosphate isomerase/epimerase, partial [Candidatus Saccharimonadales bacterium]|nr:sugar phosphate isomerase/epimerase [Candidatus Saccharimonadales bacterium]